MQQLDDMATTVQTEEVSVALDGRYLGIDLAWADRNRTGVAVLAWSGQLLSSRTVLSDKHILDFIDEHCSGPVVAAVNAPLIVPNEGGQRDCEGDLARDFGRFQAGPYPANRRNPALARGPRGGRLAERLGWALDPSVRPSPLVSQAIEVFPHPAMVSLFGLRTAVPYKARPGRTLLELQRAYHDLVRYFEDHFGSTLELDSSIRWHEIRRVIEQASRPFDLRAVEDEIDAILCAYLAWMWDNEPERLRVYGDVARGYIVTPEPPEQ